VDWRITFFIDKAEPTGDGWLVHGEVGLGPPRVGEQFDFVTHQDTGEEDQLALRIVEAGPNWLRLVTQQKAALRKGDILGGEAIRQE
jgi:hypothetical protein